ncbi:MAG: twitching motility protein PilT [Solirubrobacteraceae bacterium]
MAVICDTAVLIAADRRDRRVAALARAAAQSGHELTVTATCIAQAWRDGARQASLAHFLAGCDERVLDGVTARSAGLMLGATGTADVVDASVVCAAKPGDTILTGDPGHLVALVGAAGTARVRVEPFG